MARDKDIHAILGVRPDASEEEIRAAYARLVKIHHPDHGGNIWRFIEIQQAFEALRKRHFSPFEAPPRDVGLARVDRSDFSPDNIRETANPRAIHISGGIGKVVGLCAAALLVVIVGPRISHMPGASRTADSAIQCPTGMPQVVISSSKVQDGVSIVTGTIINSTTAAIDVEAVGFYFGPVSPAELPSWADLTGNMQTSGSPYWISSGEGIEFRETQNGPAENVSASLAFPEEAGGQVYYRWGWPGTSPACALSD